MGTKLGRDDALGTCLLLPNSEISEDSPSRHEYWWGGCLFLALARISTYQRSIFPSPTMSTNRRLPRRLVWTAVLFLLTGMGTASAGIEDFLRGVAPALSGESAGAFPGGAVLSLVISVGLGVLYFWAGFGLLRRQERWRRRAANLSRLFIGLFGLGFVVVLFGEVSAPDLGFVLDGEQQTRILPASWVIRATLLLAIGAVTSAYWWALRVVQSESVRGEFIEQSEEVSATA